MRQPPAFDRMSHRIRHADRVVRFGYRRRQHHAVAAEFHRQRRVRRGADPCIDNQRNFRLGTDDLQIVWIHDAHAGANRRAERHDGRTTDILQLPAEYRIIRTVRHNDKPFLHEFFRRLQEMFRIRVKRFAVADHLEF